MLIKLRFFWQEKIILLILIWMCIDKNESKAACNEILENTKKNE